MRLFDDAGDYLGFLRVVAEGLERFPQARLLSYCVMPNHWHLVFWPRCGADTVLSDLMRWIGTTHVRRWHLHRHSVGAGPIYQGRFKSFPIEADDHLLTVMRYVERNALRARLVDKAELWRWGSLWLSRQKAPGRKAPGSGLEPEQAALQTLLHPGPVARPRHWLSWVNRAQTEAELEALWRSVGKGRPFGGEAWGVRTAHRMGISLRGPGRPRAEG